MELSDRYQLTSNRESGFGRYDVMLEPRQLRPESRPGEADAIINDAFILEFKVQEEEEETLSDTVKAALDQIEKKQYAQNLTAKGIPEDRIRKYGFAFRGKEVLIG